MTAESLMVPIPSRGVDYRGRVVLAPMVRSGELPSRLLALHYGADLVWGPETVDHSLIGTTRRVNPHTGMIEWTRMPSNGHQKPKKSSSPAPEPRESVIYRVDPVREAGRLVFQLGTSDPERAVAAAKVVAADVAGIDVNAGCPKPFSTSGGMGAALLRTPDRLCAILRALVAAVSSDEFALGVSVKIRLLETPAETEALVRQLVATGITGLTVHCRTTPMRPREPAIRAQLPVVAAVCRAAGVACLMNGDVADRDQAERLAREYAVDGAMIATAAERNPSCFRSGGPPLAPWREVVEHYLAFAVDVENRWGNSKFTLNQLVPGKDPAYRALSQAKCYAEACDALGLDALAERARDVDDRLELRPNPKSRPASATALAAGGNMAKVRTSESHRKSVSGRGITPSQAPPVTAPAAAALPT